MSAKTILVPVDGASNIKLETLDFETLATMHSATTETPAAQSDGLAYNATGREFDWFDSIIQSLPENFRAAAVVAPVARGASGGLVGADNTLMEAPGQRLTLAYTQGYPEAVNERFAKLAGSREEFFQETGSIRDFPGSLTLLKRLLYEEMVRPQLLARAAGFGQYGALMGGHFIGDDYLAAIKQAGNEHSYWMCHTGTRDVRSKPGTPSQASRQVKGFQRLVPQPPSVCYKSIGTMPAAQAEASETFRPAAGGSGRARHLPVAPSHSLDLLSGLSRRRRQTGVAGGSRHVDDDRPDGRRGQSAGRWLHPRHHHSGNGGRRTGGHRALWRRRGFLASQKTRSVQGLGFDHRQDRRDNGQDFEGGRLLCVCPTSIRPTMAPGHFRRSKAASSTKRHFSPMASPPTSSSNLMTAMTTAHQVAAISSDASVPIVLTAGGSKDPLFGTVLATLDRPSGICHVRPERPGGHRDDHARRGHCRQGGVSGHPSLQSGHGCAGREIPPDCAAYTGEMALALQAYRAKWMQQVSGKQNSSSVILALLRSRMRRGRWRFRLINCGRFASRQSKMRSSRSARRPPSLRQADCGLLGCRLAGPLPGLPVWRRPGRACRCNRRGPPSQATPAVRVRASRGSGCWCLSIRRGSGPARR